MDPANAILLIAATIGAIVGVYVLLCPLALWLAWKFTGSLPVWLANGIKSLVLTVFFTPGLVGAVSETGGMVYPGPAWISVVAMMILPTDELLGVGWPFGVLPMLIVWPVLWLWLMWSWARKVIDRGRQLERSDVSKFEASRDRPPQQVRKDVAAAPQEMSSTTSHALVINRLWFIGGLVALPAGLVLFILVQIPPASKLGLWADFIGLILSVSMLLVGYLAVSGCPVFRPYIGPLGLFAERIGGRLDSSRFLGKPSVTFQHRGIVCRLTMDFAKAAKRRRLGRMRMCFPWHDNEPSFSVSVKSVNCLSESKLKISRGDNPRVQRLLGSQKVVEALQRLAQFETTDLQQGFYLRCELGELRIEKRGSTVDVDAIEQFVALTTVAFDFLYD